MCCRGALSSILFHHVYRLSLLLSVREVEDGCHRRYSAEIKELPKVREQFLDGFGRLTGKVRTLQESVDKYHIPKAHERDCLTAFQDRNFSTILFSNEQSVSRRARYSPPPLCHKCISANKTIGSIFLSNWLGMLHVFPPRSQSRCLVFFVYIGT